MIGTNIHDNPQRWSGRRRSPLYWLRRAGYGRSDIGQQSDTSTPVGTTNTAAVASDLSSAYQFTTPYCRGSGIVSDLITIYLTCCRPFACPSSLPMSSHRWSWITAVKAYQFNLNGPSRSTLSHHHRSTQPVEVEGTTMLVRMLDGPILLDLTHSFQRRKLTSVHA